MKRIVLALSTLIIMIASGSASVAAERKLTGADIKKMFTNSTVYFKLQNRFDGIADYKTGGVLKGAVGSNSSDTGRWWVDGDKICRKWNRWADGKKDCATVEINGERTVYRWDSGRITNTSLPKK